MLTNVTSIAYLCRMCGSREVYRCPLHSARLAWCALSYGELNPNHGPPTPTRHLQDRHDLRAPSVLPPTRGSNRRDGASEHVQGFKSYSQTTNPTQDGQGAKMNQEKCVGGAATMNKDEHSFKGHKGIMAHFVILCDRVRNFPSDNLP